MGHYKSNLRDIEFKLFEVLGRQEILGTGAVRRPRRRDRPLAAAEVERLATHELADSFMTDGPDAAGLRPGRPHRHDARGLPKSYEAYKDGGWTTSTAPADVGGHPDPVVDAVGHRRDGARLQPRRPHVLVRPGVRARLLEPRHRRAEAVGRDWAQNVWGTTMVLTEPDAGSDVGAGRTKAIPQPDGSWHIRASSASSPAASTTSRTTSSTWCWRDPRA